MSVVTSLIVAGLFWKSEARKVQYILDKFVQKTNSINPWQYLDGNACGGNKVMQSDMFAAAFNYLDKAEFLITISEVLQSVPDHVAKRIQVFVLREEDEVWNVYLASELRPDHLAD